MTSKYNWLNMFICLFVARERVKKLHGVKIKNIDPPAHMSSMNNHFKQIGQIKLISLSLD